MRKNQLTALVPFAIASFPLLLSAQNTAPQFGKSPAKEIVRAMTLEEKARVVVGKGFSVPGMKLSANDTSADRIATISGHSNPFPRLGIPSIGMADGPAGIHRFVMTAQDSADGAFSTAWPVGTALASSWDTALVTRVGTAFGEEIKSYGIDFILGPGANIHRNPLGGRNFEYYSEDPLVSGKMAAAIINGIQSQGVGATIKHFAANNQETDRASVNELISERALREIYLRNFEIAIKNSHPWAVMSSYNLINGTTTSQSHDLLTTVLRDEWGFKGLVMSDWFGGQDAVAQMKAGNDLLMPGTPAQVKAIVDGVKNGQLPESVLDLNAERVLSVWKHTLTGTGYVCSNHPDLKAHAQVSREAAAESMVLLKNDGQALPLRAGVKMAVFGTHGYDLIAGGTGSGDVNKAYAVSLAEGLANGGFGLDEEVAQKYKTYVQDYLATHPKKPLLQEFMNPTPPMPELPLEGTLDVAARAEASDAAIVYIGHNAGEGTDRKLAGDYDLPAAEKNMIAAVSEAFHARHKPVIAVLNIGGVIDVMSFRDQVDAILLAWQPGEEGGNAMTDVLSGKVNPSGKLATTFAAAYSDVPSAKNFPGKEFPEKATMGMMGRIVPAEAVYAEGIYVGYRYFNSFHVKPAYEFGYGLSYTSFSYGKATVNKPSFAGSLETSVTVTNTGKVAGREVVQLYLAAPKGKLDKPASELKGFAKTRLLQPGESQTLRFALKPADLASFYTDQSAWIADAGQYRILIARRAAISGRPRHSASRRRSSWKKCTKCLCPPRRSKRSGRKNKIAADSLFYGRKTPVSDNTMRIALPFLLALVSMQAGAQAYRKIHEKAVVVDTHNDILMKVVDLGYAMDRDLSGKAHSDLARWKTGGVDVQVFSVYCDGRTKNAFAYANRAMDSLDAVVKRNPGKIAKVYDYAGLREAVGQHKIAAMFGVEGGHMIEDDLARLDSLNRRGVVYLSLTHNISPDWATSAADESGGKALPHKGLTEFGEQVVRHMNRLGMLIDLSHAGEQTFWDVMKITTQPVIASHSSVYSLVPHPRNLKDDQIRAIAKNGGVIQVNFYPGFIDSSFGKKEAAFLRRHQREMDSLMKSGMPDYHAVDCLYAKYKEEAEAIRPPLSMLIDHIDYIKRLVGVDYIGLGSDFDGISFTPQSLDDVTTYPLITKALRERGYRKKDIRKILGGNFLRVLKANAQLQATSY